MAKLKFYLDENIPPVVAEQLSLSDIEAVSVRELELLGDSDINHLERATQMGYMLCTHDYDFTVLASDNFDHFGIAFAPHRRWLG